MDCNGIVLHSRFFATTSPALQGPVPASCTHKVVPIIASSALMPRNPSLPSTRLSSKFPASLEKGSLEAEGKFARNTDKDLRIMCEEGQLKEAIEYAELLLKGGLQLDPKSYAFLLQECAKSKAYNEGRMVR